MAAGAHVAVLGCRSRLPAALLPQRNAEVRRALNQFTLPTPLLPPQVQRMRPSPFNKQSGVAKGAKAAAGPSKLGGGAKAAAAAPAGKGKAKKVVDDSEVGVRECSRVVQHSDTCMRGVCTQQHGKLEGLPHSVTSSLMFPQSFAGRGGGGRDRHVGVSSARARGGPPARRRRQEAGVVPRGLGQRGRGGGQQQRGRGQRLCAL